MLGKALYQRPYNLMIEMCYVQLGFQLGGRYLDMPIVSWVA